MKNNMKCDIYLENNIYYIEADIPGYNKEDIKIEYNKGNINIIVKRKENNKKYLLHERRYNGLNRHFYFKDFDGDNINAKYENGVLIISIPKKEIKCNKIEIK